MKSKIEIRKFAVERAVAIMGTGAPTHNVIAKAQEIENYVLGGAVLPEVADEIESVANAMMPVLSALGGLSAEKPVAEEKKA